MYLFHLLEVEGLIFYFYICCIKNRKENKMLTQMQILKNKK